MGQQENKEKEIIQKHTDLDRRELLKGLATLPAIAAFFVSLWAKPVSYTHLTLPTICSV